MTRKDSVTLDSIIDSVPATAVLKCFMIYFTVNDLFVCLHIGFILTENKSKRDLITMLVEKNYLSDPVKTWKSTLVKDVTDSDSESGIASEAGSVVSGEGGPDFNYILNMNLWSLSKEKKEQLLTERDRKVKI